jgi:hypothetical protein
MSSSKRFACPYCNKSYSKGSFMKHVCSNAPSPLLCQSCNIPVKGMYFAFYHKQCSKKSSKNLRISPYSRRSSISSISSVSLEDKSSKSSTSVVPQSTISEVEFLRNRILKLESIIDNLTSTLHLVLSNQVGISSNLSNNIPLYDFSDINIPAETSCSFPPESS